MKQKGFTLIELLAVIVVLAVIALISVPIITSVIDKAKVGALKDSAYGILEASELYLAKNMSEGITDAIEFTCSNGKCVSGDKEITYKGQIDEGKVRIYSDSKIELCITDNKNAALKKVTEKEVIVSKGTCKYNELSYDVNELVSKDDYDDLKQEFDEYKAKFNTETTATPANIEEGKTAYDNLGNLITGTKEGGILSTTGNGASYTATKDGDVLIFTAIHYESGHSGDNGYVSIRKNGTQIYLNGRNPGVINTYKVSLVAGDVISFYAYRQSSHSDTFIYNTRVVYIG